MAPLAARRPLREVHQASATQMARCLRVLLVAAALGPTSATATARRAGRDGPFPIELEAAKGTTPAPGEGTGGVAVLMKPMPEATTMKTWSYLKESMSKIGDQVKKIFAVREDMAMLQEDLVRQEKMWQQAEMELKQENSKLRGEITQLEIQVKEGEPIKRQLMKAKQILEEEERRGKLLKEEETMNKKRWDLEVEALNRRKDNVTKLHKKVNDTANREIARAEGVHLQLLKDQATLKIAIADFDDKLRNGQREMEYQNSKSVGQQLALLQQLQSMQKGLIRIQAKLKPRSIYEAQQHQLKMDLQKETAAILALQVEHQKVVSECTAEMQEQDAIKCSEAGKLNARRTEATQFCNAVRVQNAVLKQDLAKCGMFDRVGTQAAPAASLPAGLVVPFIDRERNMPIPIPNPNPAPAPAPLPMPM